MQSVNLFELASQQSSWLTARQRTVANNIANVNTNNFKPSEVLPFKEALKADGSAMTTTHANHISTSNGEAASTVREMEPSGLSGSTQKVVLEDELIKAGEVRRSYELNTAIVKSFHRMMMMTARA